MDALLTGFAGLGVLVYFLFKLIRIVLAYHRSKRQEYLNSEKYYFDQLLKQLGNDDLSIKNAFYRWIDCLELDEYTYTYFASHWMPDDKDALPMSRSVWRTGRDRYLSREHSVTGVLSDWVNPG